MYLSLRHIALMILLCRHEKKLYNNLCLHQILVIYSHTNNRKHVIVIQSFPIYRTDSFTEIKGLVCTSEFVYLCLSQRFILFVLFVFINNIGALERLSSILCYTFFYKQIGSSMNINTSMHQTKLFLTLQICYKFLWPYLFIFQKIISIIRTLNVLNHLAH